MSFIRSTKESKLSIAWFSLQFSCPTMSLSFAGKRQFRLSWWSGKELAIYPSTTLSEAHCPCRFTFISEPQHCLGSWLHSVANNGWNSHFWNFPRFNKQQRGGCWCCYCWYSGSFFSQIYSTSLRSGDALQRLIPGISHPHILKT